MAFAKHKLKIILLLSLVAITTMMTGCGSHQAQVSPLSADLDVQHVCIEKNSSVTIDEFLPVVEDGFIRHGITSELYLGDIPGHCHAIVKYIALRSWDLKTFLSTARIHMFQNSKTVAEIIYFHPNNLNLSSKFKSIKEKIDPLMDEMLVEYPLSP